MNLGLTIDKLLLIGMLAAILIGPTRLPHYTAQLGKLIRGARGWMRTARERAREELGPDFDDVDWKKLDPRQYDPRRIIREAMDDSSAETRPTRRTP